MARAAILLIILHSLQPVLTFLVFRQISSSGKIAAIGAFVFTCNPSYIFFDSLFSYEWLGILFVAILAFLASKAYNARAPKKDVAFRSIVFIAFVAIMGIGAWIGWTMATTPPPKPIEDTTIEVEE